MASKALPPLDVLRQLLRYEPETGLLFWLTREPEWFAETAGRSAKGTANTWNAKWAGKRALAHLAEDGYLRGTILGKIYFAHRIAFFMHFGYAPDAIDHANGIKFDNRIANLRPATPSENSSNYAKVRRGAAGFRGVYRTTDAKTWRAAISCSVRGKKIHLGCFETDVEAAMAYDAAALSMHGDFATVNFPALARLTAPTDRRG